MAQNCPFWLPSPLVAKNLLGPVPENSQKNSYILVVADYWTEAYPLPNQETETVT